MIELRELKDQDAPLMLEWMHDPEIQKGFKKKMLEASLVDALSFIRESKIASEIQTGLNMHFAIADKANDRYLGTVSLKNIDVENGTAEYAIVTRKEVHGTETASLATEMILKKAFLEMGLRRVYLSVYSNNLPAIRLYEKCGFVFEGEFRNHFIFNGEYVGWKWYGILKEEYDEKYLRRGSAKK